MSMYATLEEAIDAAREEFLAANPEMEEDEASVGQFNLQKYVMQDGDIMWQAEFFANEGDEGECLSLRGGEAAQAIFDDDFDEIELRQEWLPEIRCTSGMTVSFSLSRRRKAKKVKRRQRSGKTIIAIPIAMTDS